MDSNAVRIHNMEHFLIVDDSSSSISDDIDDYCIIDLIENNDSYNYYDNMKIRLLDLDIMIWKVDI